MKVVVRKRKKGKRVEPRRVAKIAKKTRSILKTKRKKKKGLAEEAMLIKAAQKKPTLNYKLPMFVFVRGVSDFVKVDLNYI